MDSLGSMVIDVINPATQEVVSQVPSTTYEEFKDAVYAAKQAFPSWKNTPVTTRQRIMFKLQEFIHRNIDKLSMNITMEQGMTLKSAHGDVLRGLEVVEHACGVATLQMGEFVPNASNGIDTYCIREPLGVCAGICPSNFPAMIPLWMFPIAVTCGNTFVLKPCEKNPGLLLPSHVLHLYPHHSPFSSPIAGKSNKPRPLIKNLSHTHKLLGPSPFAFHLARSHCSSPSPEDTSPL